MSQHLQYTTLVFSQHFRAGHAMDHPIPHSPFQKSRLSPGIPDNKSTKDLFTRSDSSKPRRPGGERSTKKPLGEHRAVPNSKNPKATCKMLIFWLGIFALAIKLMDGSVGIGIFTYLPTCINIVR